MHLYWKKLTSCIITNLKSPKLVILIAYHKESITPNVRKYKWLSAIKIDFILKNNNEVQFKRCK